MHNDHFRLKNTKINIENFLSMMSAAERSDISQVGKKAKAVFTLFFPDLGEAIEHLSAETGISARLLYAFNNPVSISNEAFDGCSNYLSVGKSSRNNQTLLHKTRDTYRVYHGNWSLETPEGKYKFIRSACVGDFSAGMGINEKGLVVATNGVRSRETHGWGLHHRLTARKILEDAGSIEEALIILDNLPRGTGFNLLLCDASGRGMVVEGTAYHLWHEIITDGFSVTTNHHFRALAEYQDEKRASELMKYSSIPRYDSAWQYLSSRDGDITLEDMNHLSRSHEGNPGAFPFGGTVCSHGAVWSTTTAGTFTVSAEHPNILSGVWASAGFPCSIPYVPLYICQNRMPEELSNGGYFHLAEKFFMCMPAQERVALLNNIEGTSIKNAAAAEKTAKKYIDQEKPLAAAKHLSDFSLSAVAETVQSLEEKVGKYLSIEQRPSKLQMDLPDEIPIIPTPQDRPIRYGLVNMTNAVMNVSASIDGLEEKFWNPHPRNLLIPPGQTATGTLILSPEWKAPDKKTVVECLIREVASGQILIRRKTRLVNRNR